MLLGDLSLLRLKVVTVGLDLPLELLDCGLMAFFELSHLVLKLQHMLGLFKILIVSLGFQLNNLLVLSLKLAKNRIFFIPEGITV